jgi:hypothetical protein
MPKAQPKLLNNDTQEVLEVKQYPFPVRGEPITLLIDGNEIHARRTAWRDLKYTYFKIEKDGALGQYFVAGHIGDEPGYTMQYPEAFQPTQFKSDREKMAERAKELRAEKGDKPAEAAVENEDEEDTVEDEEDNVEDEATPAEVVKTPAPKAKKGGRKVSAEA